MVQNHKFLIILVVIIFGNINFVGSTGKTTKESAPLYFKQIYPSIPHYSTYINQTTNEFNLYTSYLNSSGVVIEHDQIMSDSSLISNQTIVYIDNLTDPQLRIVDFNYFVSNDKNLFVLSVYYQNTDYLSFANLNTNASYYIKGTVDYYIASVTRFSTSNDVYFCVYNSTNFFIIKFSFLSGNFSIVFNTSKIAPVNSEITNANVFTLNDQIYVLLTVRDKTSSWIATSYVYIFHLNFSFFTKTFNNLAVTTFCLLTNSLLLYSMDNSTFFEYNYSNDIIFPLSFDFTSLIYKISYLSSFDEYSFLALSFDKLSVITINYNTSRPLLQVSSSYDVINNQYSKTQPIIKAFIFSNEKSYMYSNLNQNNGNEIMIYNINAIPADFLLRTTSVGLSMATGHPPDLSYSPTYTFILFTVIAVITIGTLVLIATKSSRKRQYKLKNVSDFNSKYNLSNLEGLPPSKVQPFCPKCGSSILAGDVFCQNCGEKITK